MKIKSSVVRLAAVTSIGGLFAIALLAGSPGIAGSGDDRDKSASGEMRETTQFSNKDLQFLNRVMLSNRAEIEAARMARNKAMDPEVKDLAQMIERDHEQLSNRVKAMTDKAPPMASAQPNQANDHQHAMGDLRTATGEEFDRLFVSHMSQKHDATIAEFRAVAEDESYSAQVRALARETLPVLQRHEDRASNLREGLVSR